MLTKISLSDGTARSIESTSADEQEQRVKTVAEVDASNLYKDTVKGGPSRSGSGSMQDGKLTCLVESRQSSGESVTSGFLKSRSGPAAVGTKPSTKEGAPMTRQPLPSASREQPSIVTNTTLAICNEQAVVKTTQASLVSLVSGTKLS